MPLTKHGRFTDTNRASQRNNRQSLQDRCIEFSERTTPCIRPNQRIERAVCSLRRFWYVVVRQVIKTPMISPQIANSSTSLFATATRPSQSNAFYLFFADPSSISVNVAGALAVCYFGRQHVSLGGVYASYFMGQSVGCADFSAAEQWRHGCVHTRRFCCN